MCYFITLGIQKDQVRVLNNVVPRDLSAWRCENPYILKRMEVSCHGYALTDGNCSCDLYSRPAGHMDSADPHSKRRRKYEKRGWSAAKIQRALDDSSAYRKPNKVGLRDDVRMLIADIVDKAGRVDVFVHFYSGDQMTERLTITKNATVSSQEIRSGAYMLEPDVLTTVVAKKGRR